MGMSRGGGLAGAVVVALVILREKAKGGTSKESEGCKVKERVKEPERRKNKRERDSVEASIRV